MVGRQIIDVIKRDVGDAKDTRTAIINAYNSEEKIKRKLKQMEKEKNVEKGTDKKSLYIPEPGKVERLVIDRNEGR